MKRGRHHRQLLEQSYQWLRTHWNPSNLDVPEELRECWMFEPADDCSEAAGFQLAVFAFGYVQYDMLSSSVPGGVKRQYSSHLLLSLFSQWQLKLALAEVHKHTGLRVHALPLFEFRPEEKVEVWCDKFG